MGRRRRAREFALQILFQIDLTGDDAPGVFERFWPSVEADDEVRAFAEWLVGGVLDERDAIDRRIGDAARRWRLERMAAVDRNVLRLATHELLRGDNPAPVVIDEAIEVARRFGSEESGSFINAVLDRIREQVETERPPSDS